VNFLQNHDQIGNRALGERLSTLVKDDAALVAATSVLLLAPSPPMLFMGEEWAAPEPFIYFCDFEPELAEKVREGRKREFARFKHFSAEGGTGSLPDPTDPETFETVKLDWQKVHEPVHAGWLEHYRRLLTIRQRDIVPRIPDIRSGECLTQEENGTLAVDWGMRDGSILHLIANLSDKPAPMVGRTAGRVIYTTHPNIRAAFKSNTLDPWTVTWLLERPSAGD
jgi:1,4-alpha-glucan branching enzyme